MVDLDASNEVHYTTIQSLYVKHNSQIVINY